MINIKVRKNKYIDIEVDGHAGSDDIGKDVVCAAVSTIVLTLTRAMNQIHATGFEATLQNGHAKIRCRNTKANKAYIHMALSGFVMLSGMYPQYIKLDKRNYEDAKGNG